MRINLKFNDDDDDDDNNNNNNNNYYYYYYYIMVVLSLKLSHNESMMPEIWCEIDKGKFFVLFSCRVLISNSVWFQESVMSWVF